jgi:hypothetical protein
MSSVKLMATSLVVDIILLLVTTESIPRSYVLRLHEKVIENKSPRGSTGSATSLVVDIILPLVTTEPIPRVYVLRLHEKVIEKQESQGIHRIVHKSCRGHYCTSRDKGMSLGFRSYVLRVHEKVIENKSPRGSSGSSTSLVVDIILLLVTTESIPRSYVLRVHEKVIEKTRVPGDPQDRPQVLSWTLFYLSRQREVSRV